MDVRDAVPVRWFLVLHTHPAERCPFHEKAATRALEALMSAENCSKHGLVVQAFSLGNRVHRFWLVVGATHEGVPRRYFRPLEGFGTLEVIATVPIEEALRRKRC